MSELTLHFSSFSLFLCSLVCILPIVPATPFSEQRRYSPSGKEKTADLGHSEVVGCEGNTYASVLLGMEAGRITQITGQKGWCDLLRTMCTVTLSGRNIRFVNKHKKAPTLACW